MLKVALFLNIVYLLLFSLFLIDISESFDLHGNSIKKVVYFGTVIGSIVLLVINLLNIRENKLFILGLICPIIFFFTFSSIGILKFMFSSSTWNVQHQEYILKDDPNWVIEFQMQDIGIKGYKRRTVAVKHITSWLMYVKPCPEIIDTNQWKVDGKYIEELKWLD